MNIPSATTESEYIWNTIRDIKFFEEHNYQVSLPKGDIIEELKHKSVSENLNNEDYERLEKFVKDSVYNKADYQQGYDKIAGELSLINKMIEQIKTSDFNWDFKEFKTYSINLTLYGPGGSYNSDEGSILICTTSTGQFKNYDNPSYTIIHEVIHIGIEEAIIAKYHVPHALKERIVDTFVSLNFSQYLPGYRIQDMGDNRTDQYLKTISDLKNLGKIVDQILNKK
ncbi:MAG: hypothetical protein H6565_09895 [Lewinellaceae bacterium]|nr:hypothetical protein [Lewinellaceae bacterium]MCB9354330.1 hypothetical protein [Lewinellaceae bacterium]